MTDLASSTRTQHIRISFQISKRLIAPIALVVILSFWAILIAFSHTPSDHQLTEPSAAGPTSTSQIKIDCTSLEQGVGLKIALSYSGPGAHQTAQRLSPSLQALSATLCDPPPH